MKKIFLALFIILLSACSLNMNNSPKARVKELLDRYKNQDSAILSNLDDVIDEEYRGSYKDRYKTLMTNQYKDLEYKITDEIIDGDTAIVTADVTVYNYGEAIDSANIYLREHLDEFSKDTTSEQEIIIDNSDEKEDENTNNSEKESINSSNSDDKVDMDKFLEYKFRLLEGVTDRKTYSLDFTLTKENDEWVLDELSNDVMSKLHGIYTE